MGIFAFCKMKQSMSSLIMLCTLFVSVSAALDCCNIPIQSNSTANRVSIQQCLDTKGIAVLYSVGVYDVDAGITVPEKGQLTGNLNTTLRLTSNPTQGNFLVSVGSNSRIGFLTLDVNGQLPQGCCSAGIIIGSVTGAVVHDCIIVATGVYFLDKTATNNQIQRVAITAFFYGVIFVDGLPQGSANQIQNCVVHDNHCDSVTFAGYGEVVDCHVHNNGWDCQNGSPPIPGGGPYCLGNTVGGLVVGTTVENNCGMLLDIDSCANFNVTGNNFSQPGNTWGGLYPYCQGTPAVQLLDTQSFTFQGNTVSNTRSTNAVGLSHWGDPNHIYSDVNSRAAFLDLPGIGNTVLALSITTRPTTINSMSNAVTQNSCHADCSYPSGCVGVGYFAGRGTGYSGRSGGPWKPNTYTLNDPFGSNIGSTRCGGNWYAGNTPVCPAVSPPAPCNTDDYQHPDTGNWRNDPGCAMYS